MRTLSCFLMLFAAGAGWGQTFYMFPAEGAFVGPTSVSGDGSVAVGHDGSDGWVWKKGKTAADVTFVTSPIAGHEIILRSVSDDGMTVVGESYPSGGTRRAFVWSEASGLQFLPGLDEPIGESVDAISGDGGVILGKAEHRQGSSPWSHPVMWTDVASGPTLLVDNGQFRATGLSDDGAKIVYGTSSRVCGIGIGTCIEAATRGRISGDGSVLSYRRRDGIGGAKIVNLENQEVLEVEMDINALSDDGSVAVGTGYWTEATGVRTLRDVIIDTGFPLSEKMVLGPALAVSDDGMTFVGRGEFDGYPTGWIASLHPASPFDFNQDNFINATDIDALASNHGSDNAKFDLDGNGIVEFCVGCGDSDSLIRSELGTEYGDADLDGTVSLADLDVLGQNYGESGGWSSGDFSGDGKVSLLDLDVLGQHYGFVASNETVPEPSTAVILLLGVVFAVARRTPINRV